MNFRVALSQINTTVGDISGNADLVIDRCRWAADHDVDLIAFPELTLPGYPPEDLVLKPDFIRRNRCELARVAAEVGDVTAVVGFVDMDSDIYNAAAVIQKGQVVGVYHKCFLPNYAVFDEQRYFKAGTSGAVFGIRGANVGITVCEDIWYPVGPATVETMAGAEVIININASPFSTGRQKLRERMIATRAQDEIAYVCYVNLVGGQDELVFEGASMIIDWRGEVIARAAPFEEDLVVADLDIDGVFSARLHDTRRRQMPDEPAPPWRPTSKLTTPLESVEPVHRKTATPTPLDRPPFLCGPMGTGETHPKMAQLTTEEEVYFALVLGLRDYVAKNGFTDVVVGLSGGIDSSLVALIAVDTLGSQHVVGVSMPSRYSSEHSRTDADALARNLGIRLVTIPIEQPFEASLHVLSEAFEGTQPGVAEENLQARIRGNLLMALNNKFNWLVLTTGNKSEVAVGFSTLYGDTAGGFAVIKDIYKTTLYRLVEWRNRLAGSPLIPQSVVDKAPSAELAPDQRDVDRLPPYEQLDPILHLYVEEDRSREDIVNLGHDPEMVRKVIRLVDANEFKRRQQPPGPRVSNRAFGKDRRLPITNGFRTG